MLFYCFATLLLYSNNILIDIINEINILIDIINEINILINALTDFCSKNKK